MLRTSTGTYYDTDIIYDMSSLRRDSLGLWACPITPAVRHANILEVKPTMSGGSVQHLTIADDVKPLGLATACTNYVLAVGL
jgi:hypothetical protein